MVNQLAGSSARSACLECGILNATSSHGAVSSTSKCVCTVTRLASLRYGTVYDCVFTGSAIARPRAESTR